MNPELIIQTLRDAGPQRNDPRVSGPYRHLAGLIEAHVIGEPYFDQHPPHTLTPTQWTLLRHGVASIRDGRATVALRQAAERLAASLKPIAVIDQMGPVWGEPASDALDDAVGGDTDPADVSPQSAADTIIYPPVLPGPHKLERADPPQAPVEPHFNPRSAHPRITPTAQSAPADPAQVSPLPHDDQPLSYGAAGQVTDAHEALPRAIHYDAFISFDQEDNRLRERIERHLHQQGFQVFSDRRINPGTPAWERTIEEAIRESLALVIVQTPSAARSEWVRREISYARRYNVPLLALLAGDERRSALLDIDPTQRIDIRGGRYDTGMRVLLRELRRRRSAHRG